MLISLVKPIFHYSYMHWNLSFLDRLKQSNNSLTARSAVNNPQLQLYLALHPAISHPDILSYLQTTKKNSKDKSTKISVNCKGIQATAETLCCSSGYTHVAKFAILKQLLKDLAIKPKYPLQLSRSLDKKNNSLTLSKTSSLKTLRPLQFSREFVQFIQYKEQVKQEIRLPRVSSQSDSVLSWCIKYKQNKDKVSQIVSFLSKIIGFRSNNHIYTYLLAKDINFSCQQISLRALLQKPLKIQVGLSDFQLLKCLGVGGYAKVYMVQSRLNGKIYAMKLMLKNFIKKSQKEDIIYNQRNILAKLNHPFVVKMHFAFQTNSFVAFVMDYCHGGQLFYLLKQRSRMSQSQAKFYFCQVLVGIQYLHSQNVLYRDLKPQNLLIGQDGHLIIADFGLSKQVDQVRTMNYTYCGSIQYMPPQMLLCSGHNYTVDFYTLLLGMPPFYTSDRQDMKLAIIQDQLNFPPDSNLSYELMNLLSSLLNKSPNLRLGSLYGVKEIFAHPWIGKCSIQKVTKKGLTPPFVPSPFMFYFDTQELGDDFQQFNRLLFKQKKRNLPFQPQFQQLYFCSGQQTTQQQTARFSYGLSTIKKVKRERVSKTYRK